MRYLLEDDALLPTLGCRDGLGVVTVLAAFTLDAPPVLWPSPADLHGWLAEAAPGAILDEGRPKPRGEFLAIGPGLRVQVGDVAATLDTALPYAPDDPRRTRLLGPFDARWKAQRWPDLPEGTDPDYALVAPGSQRLAGYFRGDEAIRIQGTVERSSRLPGIRVRALLEQLQDGRPGFREVTLRAETLWLFPDRGMAGLLFRGAVRVADPDLDDLLGLLVQREALADRPGSREALEAAYRRLAEPPAEAPAEADAGTNAGATPEPPPPAAPPAPVGPGPAPGPARPPEPDPDPELAALEAQGAALSTRLEAALAGLAGLGLAAADPERLLADLPPEPPPAAPPEIGPEALERSLADLRTRMRATLPELDWEAPIPPAAAKPVPPPLPRVDDLLAELRRAGLDDPALEDGLRAMERARLETEREAAAAPVPETEAEAEAEAGAPAAAEPDPDPPEAGTGRDFTGQDFTGQDLAGRDFSEAILERARFRDARLDGARFSGAVLLDADFHGARLRAARLDGAVAGTARFGTADLSGADLTGADCTGADLAGADLSGATLDRAVFNQADLEGARLVDAHGAGAEFQEARLVRADLTGARLADADCSGALLDGALLDRVEAPELRLTGARGTDVRFRAASLPGCRADADTCLARADFRQADLTGAGWAGAAFPDGQFAGAALAQADLSGARLARADLRCCRAREARLAKADLEGADLRGIDLFQGSLRQARLVDTDLRDGNLFGVDCFKAVLGRTRWDGANLKRTLLAEVRP